MPGYISNQKAIVFGYTQGTASQSIAVDAALNAAGAGVELKGYTYSWYFYNSDLNRGTATGTISLRSSQGSVLESYNYNMPQQTVQNWHQMSGSQLFSNPYQIGQVSTLDVSFTGKDDRFWAGYYGPAIKNVDVRLMYGVDPCATNPAYSTTCAGFNQVLTSTNLVPSPDGYAVYGNIINQSYAINTALSAAGSNAMIHGFKWGYVANANGPYCNSWDMGFLGCWDFRVPSVSTNVNITSSTGASLYNVSRTYTNSYNTTEYSYLFPSSRPMNTLGNFNFTATTNDVAYVGSMWSKAVYTVDPCVSNPLYSPTCPGYGAAILGNTTTSSSTTYTAPVATTATTSVVSTDPTVAAPTTTNVGGVELSSSGTISAPDGVPQVVKDSQPAVASSSSSSTTTTSTSSGGGSKPNMALVMNAVRAVQEQNKANESRAVSNAQAVVASSTAQSQETAATVIANIATANAISSQSTQQASQQQATLSGVGLNVGRQSGQGIAVFGLGNNVALSSTTNQQQVSNYRFESNVQSNDNQVTMQQTTSGSRTDPLSMMMQQNNLLQQSNIEQRSETVKRNVQPNELAGGVDIASMAVQPVGFGSYSVALKDSQFYTPKEIYKNQEVIDNRRALRQLGNDSLHQQLINLQYK